MKNDNQGRIGQSISILRNHLITNTNEQQTEQRESSSQKIKIYSKIQSKTQVRSIYVHKNTVYVGTKNARILIYKIEQIDKEDILADEQDFTLKQQKIITLHSDVVSMINADDNYFVWVPQTDEASFVSLWSAPTRQFLTAFKGHTSQVSQIVFMTYKNYIATSSWDCTVRIWELHDFEKEEPVKIFNGHYAILDLKQFNEEILVFGGDDCYLVFWNWKKNEIVKREFGHAGSVTYIEVMDRQIFTCGGDNKFKYWEVSTVQSSDVSRQDVQMNFKSKYQTKQLAELKEEYDSIVFGRTFDKKHIVVIDQQGELFLFVNDKTYYRLENLLEYNQNITGMHVFGDFVLVATSKGCLKHFSMKREMARLKVTLPSEHIVFSETNIVQLKSDQQNKISQQQHQSEHD